MDDSRVARFFAQPQDDEQRRYELLRAVFLERRPQQLVAEQFGVSYASVRRLVSDFRRDVHSGASPFCFLPADAAVPAAKATR